MTATPPTPAQAGQRRLHLAELDPESTDLHLLVGPADELHHAPGRPAHQVPGGVHPGARLAVRVGDEPPRGRPGLIQVAAGHAGTRDVQLAGAPGGTGTQVTCPGCTPACCRSAARWAPRPAPRRAPASGSWSRRWSSRSARTRRPRRGRGRRPAPGATAAAETTSPPVHTSPAPARQSGASCATTRNRPEVSHSAGDPVPGDQPAQRLGVQVAGRGPRPPRHRAAAAPRARRWRRRRPAASAAAPAGVRAGRSGCRGPARPRRGGTRQPLWGYRWSPRCTPRRRGCPDVPGRRARSPVHR